VIASVPVVVTGDPVTVSHEGTVWATLVTVPDPPEIVLQPKPVPLVQVSALETVEQEGNASPDGNVAVKAPRTVFAETDANPIVPVAVIGPPVTPLFVAMLVTVPEPPPPPLGMIGPVGA
jgi:hypothetical protein